MTDRDVSSWLPNLLGPLDIQVAGVALSIPRRSTFNFVGFDIEDDPDNERTVITASGSGTTPTGSGFVTVTGGVQDAAAASAAAGILTFLATPSGANLAAALTSALPLSKGGTGLTAVPGSDTQVLMNASSAYGAAANVTYVGGFLICATDLKLSNSGFELRLSPGTLGASFTVTLPGQATTLIGRTTTDTLTGKSMSWGSNTFTLTSAQLATACSDETGSGALVFGTSPTISGPTISGSPVISATDMSATGNARGKMYSNIASVQTTDATVTSLFTWTILDEAMTLATAEVGADQSTGANCAAYVRRRKFKRDGGAVTAGTEETTFSEEDVAGWDCTIDNSTSTGRVRVTGAAATTIDWAGITTRFEVAHA